MNSDLQPIAQLNFLQSCDYVVFRPILNAIDYRKTLKIGFLGTQQACEAGCLVGLVNHPLK